MRIVALALLCALAAAGCRDEPETPHQIAAEISRRDPSQAPQQLPRIYTGARVKEVAPMPKPVPEPRRENDVMITGGMIEVTPVLPRRHTRLRLRNMTDEVHAIQLTGGGDSRTVKVKPQDEATLEARLGEGTYELTCTLPGHYERGRFETYEPVVPR